MYTFCIRTINKQAYVKAASVRDAMNKAEAAEKICKLTIMASVVVAVITGLFTIGGAYISKIEPPKEIFYRTVAHLENPNIGVRQGGIHDLGLLAHENEELHWQIMETLTAYIRDNTVEPTKEKCNKKIGDDIQAALTVIGHRSEERRKKEKKDGQSLNLTNSCLYLADLNGAHLEGADLRGAYLSFADFRGAHLEGADLSGANVQDSHFIEANLDGANLTEADLWDVNLTEANLENANLRRANLCNTKATFAVNLTQEQIDIAFGDAATTLPDDLARPSYWSNKELNRSESKSEWRKWRHRRSQSQE